tara:strand:- start:17235 stop:17903 length:669 start_codon:yes stop_codon:yes gene_type:complete
MGGQYTTPRGTVVTGREGFSLFGLGATPATGQNYNYTASPELEAELAAQWDPIMDAEALQEEALRDYMGSLEGAERRGRTALRGEAARGMAAGMGQAGGRVHPAMLRQQALSGGIAEAEFEAEVAPGIRLARSEAAQGLAELGSAQAERSSAMRVEAMNQVRRIVEAGEGFFTDDTAGMADKLTRLAEVTAHPETRAYYYQEAARIRNTSSNLFTKLGKRLA